MLVEGPIHDFNTSTFEKFDVIVSAALIEMIDAAVVDRTDAEIAVATKWPDTVSGGLVCFIAEILYVAAALPFANNSLTGVEFTRRSTETHSKYFPPIPKRQLPRVRESVLA